MKKLTDEQVEWRDHLLKELRKTGDYYSDMFARELLNDPEILEALRYAHVTYANQPEENDTPEQQQGTEEKCCGNCTHFPNEDHDGYGLCWVSYDGVDPKSLTERHCDDVCERHERRSE